MRKHVIWVTAACCGALSLSLAACVPNVESGQLEKTPGLNEESLAGPAPSPAQGASMQDIYAYNEERAEEWKPEIVTMADGIQVQRTPDSGNWGIYGDSPSFYNTMYLNADNRGCESCHSNGLVDLVENNLSMSHYSIDFGLGTVVDVKDCLACHEIAPETSPAHSFGHLMHGIHGRDSFKGDCMSCHTASADGAGMQLWEESKYDILKGINKLANVEGNFSYSQDVLAGTPTWTNHSESSAIPQENLMGPLSGDSPSDELFNDWEIVVSGMVDNPYSITLKELIEEAPVETFVSKMHCIINPNGGEDIGNFEVTGVPVSWLLEKAGVQDGALNILPHASDGYEWGYGFSLDEIADEGAWIIWEINGERLSNLEGYPARLWMPMRGASGSIRWLTEIEVTDQEVINDGGGYINDYIDENGLHHMSGSDGALWANKPNAAICHTYEGQIIPLGQEYVFEGYADAFDEQVIAVEFSMDDGETWTRFDVSDSNPMKWVYWNFGFTPEEKGAYTLSVRAISSETGESVYVDKVMVNAK